MNTSAASVTHNVRTGKRRLKALQQLEELAAGSRVVYRSSLHCRGYWLLVVIKEHIVKEVFLGTTIAQAFASIQKRPNQRTRRYAED